MILLDPHAFLWLCLEPKRLSRLATAAIRQATNTGGLVIASISLWEIAMLVSLGRLLPHGTPENWLSELIETSGVTVKEITPAIAVLSTQFPRDFPGDPADRMIAATARADGISLVTRNQGIRASKLVKTVW